MNELIHYLIHFLLGEETPEVVVESVGYTADRERFARYNVVIVPSGFFDEPMYGTLASLPALPLQEIEGIPLLFGEPTMEWVGDTRVVHADILASAYFLLTRYEEMVRRQVRDEHGRFPGKESLPFRAGFLHRPIVDEYGLMLRRWLHQTGLHLSEAKPGIRKVYLTHDIDAPTLYRSWKGLIRSLRDGRGLCASLTGKFGALERDPYYTFPWIFQQDGLLKEALKERCELFFFVRSGGKAVQDKPHYDLQGTDMCRLLHEAAARGVRIGLHASYQAGQTPALLPHEKEKLEKRMGYPICHNRHHFLGNREPEDTDYLEAAGITDDYTMGYADTAGFRLGTCRPVRWINPATRRLSSLRLHPLIIMDCTLEAAKYMNLSREEAKSYCANLIEQAFYAGGEVTLLWHNTALMDIPENYQRELYAYLLRELED